MHTTEGRLVLVVLEPGASDSTDAWEGFLTGMVGRGLRADTGHLRRRPGAARRR